MKHELNFVFTKSITRRFCRSVKEVGIQKKSRDSWNFNHQKERTEFKRNEAEQKQGRATRARKKQPDSP